MEHPIGSHGDQDRSDQQCRDAQTGLHEADRVALRSVLDNGEENS